MRPAMTTTDTRPHEISFELPPRIATAFALPVVMHKRNAILVGLALGAATGTVVALVAPNEFDEQFATVCAASTGVHAWIWWRFLMRYSTFAPRMCISAALAASSAGAAFSLATLYGNLNSQPPKTIAALIATIPSQYLTGATVGALIWVPALGVSLVLFTHALRQHAIAKSGDRGSRDTADQATATTCYWLSGMALLVAGFRWDLGGAIALPLVLGLSGLIGGVLNALSAAKRPRIRQVFIGEVCAGMYPQLTYQSSDSGDVIAYRALEGGAYRQAALLTVVIQV
jgi:hypothetical protein